MALHGLISVNGATIGGWVAVRRGENPNPEPDDLLTYDCDVQMHEDAVGGPRKVSVVVVHRYGDGALELVAKLTAAAATAPRYAPRAS